MEGKITKVTDKGFFFIDDEYWCHNNNYKNQPIEGDIVEYERQLKDGRKVAKNAKFKRSAPNEMDNYLVELRSGYFSSADYLKEEFIIKYPMLLANLFFGKGNKVNQIRNYYEHVINIAGTYKTTKDFQRSKIELTKLIPLATKSYDKKNITNEFKVYIIENVKQALNDEESFIKGFVQHFECLVNYFPSKT